jgi:hypothetical protein
MVRREVIKHWVREALQAHPYALSLGCAVSPAIVAVINEDDPPLLSCHVHAGILRPAAAQPCRAHRPASQVGA